MNTQVAEILMSLSTNNATSDSASNNSGGTSGDDSSSGKQTNDSLMSIDDIKYNVSQELNEDSDDGDCEKSLLKDDTSSYNSEELENLR